MENKAPEWLNAAKEYSRELRTRFHSPTLPPAYTPAHPRRVERPALPSRRVHVAPRQIEEPTNWPAKDSNSDSSELDVFHPRSIATRRRPEAIMVWPPEPARMVPANEPEPIWLQLIDHELFNHWSPDHLWPELALVDRDLLGPIRVEAWTLRREDIEARALIRLLTFLRFCSNISRLETLNIVGTIGTVPTVPTIYI
ncbi:hypothetical protein IW261DRAFT_1568513 [Armillaria novae-zelandiae]|uniref:Uncharacterized protein n=1 Tax=Armillaria novae-zelandiae TaxID=153914 RepID=A0AA39NZ22_9AGAR|nr:hypothetical protein IW261DRAFT_1568513 [Armillaria novae-zelandiae]